MIYYPEGCDDLIAEHFCDPCEEPELGRIRSIALIKKAFEFNDPSSALEWQTGFDNGDIIIIPATRGTYDGGSEVLVAGYGDVNERQTGYNHVLDFTDPNYRTNAPFYISIKNSRQWKAAYRTETQIHLIDSTVMLIPKNPVQDDLNSEVVWAVSMRWQSKNPPVPYDVPPGIFDQCVVNV